MKQIDEHVRTMVTRLVDEVYRSNQKMEVALGLGGSTVRRWLDGVTNAMHDTTWRMIEREYRRHFPVDGNNIEAADDSSASYETGHSQENDQCIELSAGNLLIRAFPDRVEIRARNQRRNES